MIDLEAIKARWKVSAARRQGAEGSLAAMRSASDVPALVAEVERLRAEVEGLTDAYDSLKSDADAVVGGLKEDYAGLAAEVERLRVALDEAQLRSIEARNPGIDMAEVRRIRQAPLGDRRGFKVDL